MSDIRPVEAASRPADLGVGFGWVIVELAPDAIVICDDDGRIMMVNRHVETLFGYDRDTLFDAPIECLVPARFRRAHEAHRANYTAAPRLRPMGAGRQLFGRHADGSEFPVEISLSPAATAHGVATVVIIRDVTEQRAVEQAARAVSVLEHDERVAAEFHDRVIRYLFECGFSLASVLSRSEHDDGIAAEVQGVIDKLDTTIREIRTTVFMHLDHEPAARGDLPNT